MADDTTQKLHIGSAKSLPAYYNALVSLLRLLLISNIIFVEVIDMKIHVTKSYGDRADRSMSTWIQLFRSYNKIRAKESAYIQSFGLTMNQFQVLEVLYHRGDLSVGEITKLTMGTHGNTTVVVKNLKRDGWISSVLHENDKRSSILSITDKGKTIIEDLFPRHAKNFEGYFDVLSDDEVDTLFSLLRKLNKAQ